MSPADIAGRLKADRPYKLRVVLNDDSEKAVAIPRGRNRWHAAARILDEMPWATIYPIDAHGSVCAPPINREDGAPATELETVAPNPTAALVQVVVGLLAPLVRDVHKTATTSVTDLMVKMRATVREEMRDVLDSYAKLSTMALNRGTGFEERANELQAENDELREAIVELRSRAKPDDDEEDGDSVRSKTIDGLIRKLVGDDEKKPSEAAKPGGSNGTPAPAAG